MTEVKYVSESIPAHGKVRVLMRDGKWECGEDERQMSYAEWCERQRQMLIENADAALQPPSIRLQKPEATQELAKPATRPWGSL